MYFDALTTAAVADELQHTLLGGRVQEVFLLDALSIGLEVYAGAERHYLLASAHPQHARIHLAAQKLRRGPAIVPPLVLMLRKYVRGGRLIDIQQPAFERILRLEVSHAEGRASLIVEIMGRYANIILIDSAGQVMDAVKRVGPKLSRRTVLPGQPYTPPPARSGLPPDALTGLRLQTLLAQAAEVDAKIPAWRVLVQGVQALSPLLAREAVYRATGNSDTPAAALACVSSLLETLQELLAPFWQGRWQPCLACQDGEIVAFAPYPLRQYADCRPVAGINAAVAAYFESLLGADAYAAARRRAAQSIEEAYRRLERKRAALERSQTASDRADELRLKGEMTLAYAHTVQPGQTELLASPDPDGPPLRITLDPKRSAVENARRYFREYEKAKGATAEVPPLLAQVDLERRYLDQLATDLALAASRPEIAEVEEALARAGFLPAIKSAAKVPRSRPLQIESADGLLILVGRNSRQNEEVTFKRAAPDDLWLHARGIPGGHVIVKSGGRPAPERTLRQAAALAAYYSGNRNEESVAIDYTQRRLVRHVRGGQPGLVTYRGERTLYVKPSGEIDW
ncbi:MAG: Rqc2 family fibronectin-binding protein [Chloroflexota bacterium]